MTLFYFKIHLDLAVTQAMQEKINLLKEKVDFLEDGGRRIHGLYNKCQEQIKILQNKVDTCEP